MLRPIAGATFELPLKPFLCYDVSGKLWHLANYRDFFPPIKKTYRSYWALPKGLSQYFIIYMKDFFPLHRNFKEAIFINNCLIFSLSSRPLEVTRWKERSARERHAREEGVNDFHRTLGRALALSSRVSPARHVFSCAHYFQASSAQAKT